MPAYTAKKAKQVQALAELPVPTQDAFVSAFVSSTGEEAPAQPATADVPELVAEPPDYPKELYNDAHCMNDRINFELELAAAMQPKVVEYTPPPVAPAIAERTRLEMEAGAKRVAEMAVIEAERRAIVAQRKPDQWEAQTKEVFRPGEYVPDPRKPAPPSAQTLANR